MHSTTTTHTPPFMKALVAPKLKSNEGIQKQNFSLDGLTPRRSHLGPGDHILPCVGPGKLNVHTPAITFLPGARSCKTLHMPLARQM